jgi:transcriptional regulator with XRE-family HTH domain
MTSNSYLPELTRRANINNSMTKSTTKRPGGFEIREILSRNIKHLRKKLGLSQLALSNKAGLAHNYVNDIESMKKWPSPESLAKLLSVLDVEPAQLFTANPLDERQTKQIHIYLDELSARFNAAVGEIKTSYLRFEDDKTERSPLRRTYKPGED